MSVFAQRRRGYKAGVILLFLSALMATWGVITPGWLRSEDMDGGGVIFSDLWFINCQHDFTNCETAQFTVEDAPFLTTIGLSCLGLLLLLCACAVVIRANFCLTVPSHGRAAEVLALLAGVVLFIGCMTYVGDNADFLHNYPALHYGPSFILTLSSSILSGLGGLLLSIYNKRPGTSYYSRFQPLPVPTSSASMIGAATPPVTVATIFPTTMSVQRVQGYPEKNCQSLYGYPPVTAPFQQGTVNSVYYGSQQRLYSSYENSPIFR